MKVLIDYRKNPWVLLALRAEKFSGLIRLDQQAHFLSEELFVSHLPENAARFPSVHKAEKFLEDTAKAGEEIGGTTEIYEAVKQDGKWVGVKSKDSFIRVFVPVKMYRPWKTVSASGKNPYYHDTLPDARREIKNHRRKGARILGLRFNGVELYWTENFDAILKGHEVVS